MDLDTLSLKELKKLQSDVAKAISTYEDRMKKEAIAELEAKAREMGFNLNELLGGAKGKRARGAVAPKYAHPEKPSLPWTGRGRKPNWLVEALQEGKLLEDLAI